MNPEEKRVTMMAAAPAQRWIFSHKSRSSCSCLVSVPSAFSMRRFWSSSLARTALTSPPTEATRTRRSAMASVGSDILIPHYSRRVGGVEGNAQLLGDFHCCVDVLCLGGGGLDTLFHCRLIAVQFGIPSLVLVPGE